MFPTQNLGKHSLAPRFFKSVMRNGHKCNVLLRQNMSLFSITTTLQPSNAATIAVRNPVGPAPITST